jgi:hypothetical protein
MLSDINIVRVEEEGPDVIIVTFSDRTLGAYVVEELLELRPHRETAQVESRPGPRGKAQLSPRKPESTSGCKPSLTPEQAKEIRGRVGAW